MKSIPYSKLEKGTFLIASPEITSGIFFRSVIILCDHSSAGSFGLIVNKPLNINSSNEILNQEDFANPNVHLRSGGPMQTNQMMLLHASDNPPAQSLNLCDNVHLGGDLEFLQAATNAVDGPPMLLCFGYTGWGAGILEREFLEGGWFLHPGTKAHLFQTQAEKTWKNLLLEMGGKYASLSMIPEDPTQN